MSARAQAGVAGAGSTSLDRYPSNGSISIAGIPNPNYRADAEIPCFAAVRFPKSVLDEDQLLLLSQIQELKKGKLKFKSTKAHGATFLQAWLGL